MTGRTGTAAARGDTPHLVLGVEHSCSGKRWIERPVDGREVLNIAQRLEVPEIVGRIMAARGIDVDSAETFLSPRLNALLPDPSHLLDMDIAVERLVTAIENNEPVAVFGDYDVDGATSSALLSRYFRALGRQLTVYIPDRIKEGYGPNTPALMALKDQGIKLVITVDCGTTAYEPLAEAKAAGLEVIVADHHIAEAGLPEALAVINPNRIDETSEHGQIAAVGVVFLLVIALNRALRNAHYFNGDNGVAEPKLLDWLDLVALGTVADVVPLTGLNRAFVAQGIKVMMQRRNVGISALADVAGLDEIPNAYHLGFVMGPRVNAGGRVGEAGLGATLLATDNPVEAATIAERLNNYNQERRDIEAQVQEEAMIVAEQGPTEGVVLVAGEGWHPGVIGIVASRLKDRYGVPACIVALNGDTGVGSARSISGIDLGACITAARQNGLLVKGGGHAMAAGFTVKRDDIPALREFLSERIGAGIIAQGIIPTLYIEGALGVSAATLELMESLEQLGPFGSGNAEPRFVFPDVRVVHAAVVGKDHVRCTFTDSGGGKLNAIAFGALEKETGAQLLNSGGAALHVAGKLRNNNWQGRTSVQLLLDDVAIA
ncbi:MAG: single-stranded-DNA-specific exonuclease RecJ [Proteobacteria bacterium]|nr:single-stranded-DNA-specific exonuclease RecJ [Pseudomonadota bacterium]